MPTTLGVYNHDLRRIDKLQPVQLGELDICASLSRLHRVFTEGANIIHESTKDRAGTWQRAPFAGIPVAATDTTVPTIYCDRYNRLWVWFHNDAGAQVIRSDDLGETWVPGSSIGIPVMGQDRWPRGCDGKNGPMLASWRSTTGQVNVHRVRVVGGDLRLQSFYQETIDEQLVEFHTDRRNRQHMVWNAGSLTHLRIFTQEFPGDHSPFTVATDERVKSVGAFGVNRAVYAFWHGDALHTQTTDSDNALFVGTGAEAPPIVSPPGTADMTRHYVGICRDRLNWWWLLGKRTGGGFHVWYSSDGGASWKMVEP